MSRYVSAMQRRIHSVGELGGKLKQQRESLTSESSNFSICSRSSYSYLCFYLIVLGLQKYAHGTQPLVN